MVPYGLMRGANLAAHALAIAHGIGAALACAALLYTGGLSVLPRSADKNLSRGESPAFIGAAVYVLACWYGVTFGVPVASIAIGSAAVVLLLAVLRFRWIGPAFKEQFGPASLRWVMVFVFFYALVYLFTMPPVTQDYLPPAWLGNIDLLTYVRYTKYALRLGPSNLAYPDFSYLGFIYLQTPAVFYLLGALSLFFRADPLTAAMPAAFALAALLGLLAARISRSVFLVSRGAAVTIGAILLSGPFFRYIFGQYFLSTLMSTPVTLFLVWTTVSHRPSKLCDVAAAIRYATAYVLLLFLYPLMLGVGLVAQGATVVLLLLAEGQSNDRRHSAWRTARWNAVRRCVTIGVPLGLLALLLVRRLIWSVGEALYLSRQNVNGWTLDLISPLAILGAPGTWVNALDCGFCVGLEVTGTSGQRLAAAIVAVIAVGLPVLYFSRFRSRTSPTQRALAALAAGSLVAYYGFFLLAGVSYQQWKFASYVALPWSFVVLAGGLHLFDLSAPFSRALPTRTGRRLATVLLSAGAAALVGGNLLAHTLAGPALVTFPAGLRNIAAVNAMPAFREISVMMDETFDGLSSWLALYLLPDKRVHVISQRNTPHESLSYDTVSPQRPLLIQGFGCEGIGHPETLAVSDVGCLLYAPPSLVLDTPYLFSQTYLFITFTGLGEREPDGRWNLDPIVALNVMADIRRATSLFGDVFVNLRINPYLPPGIARQRLEFSWGAGRHGAVSLVGGGFVSLQVHRADWTGLRMWTLPVSVALPDRVAPFRMYAPRGRADAPPLAALFEELSVSRVPSGVLVSVTPEADRP